MMAAVAPATEVLAPGAVGQNGIMTGPACSLGEAGSQCLRKALEGLQEEMTAALQERLQCIAAACARVGAQRLLELHEALIAAAAAEDMRWGVLAATGEVHAVTAASQPAGPASRGRDELAPVFSGPTMGRAACGGNQEEKLSATPMSKNVSVADVMVDSDTSSRIAFPSPPFADGATGSADGPSCAEPSPPAGTDEIVTSRCGSDRKVTFSIDLETVGDSVVAPCESEVALRGAAGSADIHDVSQGDEEDLDASYTLAAMYGEWGLEAAGVLEADGSNASDVGAQGANEDAREASAGEPALEEVTNQNDADQMSAEEPDPAGGGAGVLCLVPHMGPSSRSGMTFYGPATGGGPFWLRASATSALYSSSPSKGAAKPALGDLGAGGPVDSWARRRGRWNSAADGPSAFRYEFDPSAASDAVHPSWCEDASDSDLDDPRGSHAGAAAWRGRQERSSSQC